ncbi:MAG: lipid-A-disaccharide synthase [Opitutales bacterium]|jgi:lipid-A-disaccharide synthase|nr:lipid-A-disaccharide synthase [Opitutales bacterium]
MSYVPVLPDELASPAQGTVDILVIAGEHSGDEHAAVVIRKLLQDQPDLKIAAVGGELMMGAGAQLLFDLTHLSVVGFFEVLKHYKYFKQLFGTVIDWVDQHRPRAVVFVDYPGFNLRLAKALFEKGIAAKAGGETKLLYYIGPQIWAWKAKRRFEMDRLLDGLSVIFPFEVECYADTNLETTFVGHPFLQSKQDCDLVYSAEGNLLLLAGSRVSNVRRVLPILLEAYERFLANYGGRDATLVYPSETILSEIERVLEAFPKAKKRISLVRNEGGIEAGAVLTTSGTMSLRCGLAGIPGRIVHRIQGLSYVLGRILVSIPYIGIANLLLEKPYYPEYIQGDAKPSVLAKEIDRCLTDQEVIQQTQDDCKELHRRLKQENDETPWNWLLRHL